MKTNSLLIISILMLSSCKTVSALSRVELLQKPLTVQDDAAVEIQLKGAISRTANAVELDVEFDTATIVKYTPRTGGINLSRGIAELTISFVTEGGAKYSTKKTIDSFYTNGVFPRFENLPPKDILFKKMVITGKQLPKINQIYWQNKTSSQNAGYEAKSPPKAPIVVLGEIIDSKGCDKYCVYTVRLIKVRDTSGYMVAGHNINVDRLNILSQPMKHKRYVLELDLYNPAHPEYQLFRILDFREDLP